MDELINETPQAPVRRQRKKRSKFQIFKEAYLPIVIVALTVILVITFIVGSVSRAVEKRKAEKEASIAASESIALQEAEWLSESQRLLAGAEELAAELNYEAAVALIDSFSGDPAKYPDLSTKRAEYVKIMSELAVFSDPATVPHLSFQMLVADPSRAFMDEEFGNAYNRNYVTTDEFSKILQQLYDNNYMLVSVRDLLVETDGKFTAGKISLPVGKKPIVLSQVAANYFTYMTDGNEDGLPDAEGDGFPYCLALDEEGNFVSKMIGADGNEVTGNLDFVTILEAFVKEHPDFSYQGARAILAVTGYDGIFGYRTDGDTRDEQGSEYYAQQLSGAQQIVDALKDAGYDLACNSYENVSYGNSSVELIQGDLLMWNEEIAPILGEVDILVYPYGDDIAENVTDTYEGEKFEELHAAGFRIYIGMDNETTASALVNPNYFRQTRRWVTGAKMAYAPNMYSDLFDASTVLSSERGEVPADSE